MTSLLKHFFDHLKIWKPGNHEKPISFSEFMISRFCGKIQNGRRPRPEQGSYRRNMSQDLNSSILHSVLLRCAPLLVCVLAAFSPQARGDENRANGKSEIVNYACSQNLFGVNSVGKILQNSVDSVLSDHKSVPGLRHHPVRHYKKSLRCFGRRYLKPQSLAASRPVSRSTFFKTLVTTHLSIACQGRRGDRRPDTFPLII